MLLKKIAYICNYYVKTIIVEVMNKNERNIEQDVEKLYNEICPIVEQMKNINNYALEAYTPLVNDLCTRNASENDVEVMLDRLFDFCGDDRILALFKQVCRCYWHRYPSCISFYIMEYRKCYDTESFKGTEYEHLLDDK